MRSTPLDKNEIAKLRMMIRHDIAPKVPGYTCPKPPRTFRFVPGAAPVYPRSPATPFLKPKHVLTRCYGGPFEGEALDLCAERLGSTLTFTHKEQRGFYRLYRLKDECALEWVPA